MFEVRDDLKVKRLACRHLALCSTRQSSTIAHPISSPIGSRRTKKKEKGSRQDGGSSTDVGESAEEHPTRSAVGSEVCRHDTSTAAVAILTYTSIDLEEQVEALQDQEVQ